MNVRQIPLPGLSNLRELGGLPAAGGRKIKPNTLFRCGSLCAATPETTAQLQARGVCRIIDLRTSQEVLEDPSPAVPGATNIHLPVFREAAAGITREKEDGRNFLPALFPAMRQDPDYSVHYLQALYANFVLDEHVAAQYARFLDLVLDAPGATLWHCTAGKDRTGFGAMLLLEILGAERETIVQDYLLTNACMAEENERVVQGILQGQNAPELEAPLRSFFCADERFLAAVYRAADERYGSFAAFLREALGVDDTKTARFRARFLEA
jgi:protein-tyrosine phosphatase